MRKKQLIPLPNSHVPHAHIGIVTRNDTIPYDADRVSGWELVAASRDSLTISRPYHWRDSFIASGRQRYPEGYVYWSEMKTRGNRITRLLKVDASEKRSFAWQDVVEIRYPTYTGNGAGCMGCILIPVYNIGFIIWAHQRWQPKKIRIGEWKLVENERAAHLDNLMISDPASKKQPSP